MTSPLYGLLIVLLLAVCARGGSVSSESNELTEEERQIRVSCDYIRDFLDSADINSDPYDICLMTRNKPALRDVRIPLNYFLQDIINGAMFLDELDERLIQFEKLYLRTLRETCDIYPSDAAREYISYSFRTALRDLLTGQDQALTDIAFDRLTRG